jgi:hypothetical protein
LGYKKNSYSIHSMPQSLTDKIAIEMELDEDLKEPTSFKI